MKTTTLSFESLESKRALSSTSVVSPVAERSSAPTAAAQIRVQVQQTRPVLNAPRYVGTYHGAGSLGGISVSGSENTTPILAICTGRGGTITSAITDPGVYVRSMRNSAGGTNFYIAGTPSVINRNMKYLTYRGNESGINVGLFICNTTSCTKYADVVIPIRRF